MYCLLISGACPVNSCFFGHDVDELAAFFACGEDNDAVNQCVDGVILAETYVEAGMMHCAALTLDDVACLAELATENLNTKSLAF